MREYVMIDQYNKQFTIRKVDSNLFRVTFWSPYRQEFRTQLMSKNDLKGCANKLNCFFAHEAMRLFDENIFDKLTVESERDLATEKILLLHKHLSSLLLIKEKSYDGENSYYRLRVEDGDAVKLLLSQLLQCVGIDYEEALVNRLI